MKTVFNIGVSVNDKENKRETWEQIEQSNKKYTVVLATANVRLQIAGYISKPVRALLDNGSQLNIITKRCVKELKLKMMVCKQEMIGIGGEERFATRKVRACLRPHFDSHFSVQVDLFVMEELPGNFPSAPLKTDKTTPGQIIMADNTFCIPAPVDILIGASIWARIMRPKMYTNRIGTLIQETELGCIVIGLSETFQPSMEYNRAVFQISEKVDPLNELMVKFWETQEIRNAKEQRSPQEEECERVFLEKHKRDIHGRYIVQIPVRNECLPLGNSRDIALKRFLQLEKRLHKEKNKELREKYVQFMKEYLELDHMRRAFEPPDRVHFFMPHHCIKRDKFRVVFDASCQTSNGKSFNDVQLIGQKLQHDLGDQIMRFRRHETGVTADIEKMFRQVRVDPTQWDLQRIFWRETPNQPLGEYWLTVVTYGMASSVYNSVRAMIQCARDQSENYPEAAKVIENDFYVDDCLTGSDTVFGAKILCADINKILTQGGFRLRHWHSNSKEIEEFMRSEHTESVNLSETDETKVLGIKWLMDTDEFAINVRISIMPREPTKRMVLSEISRLYDPNGYVAPIVIVAKILMQDIWRARDINWDGKLNKELNDRWLQFHAEIAYLAAYRIPRWLQMSSLAVTQMHGFCDASEKAFGAVIYIRTIDYSGKITCTLLMSKSRVAPIQTVSIPRLELQAAEMLARLTSRAIEILGKPNIRCFLWTDSTITLHWLKKSPYDLKTFVANRVASVQKHTKFHVWAHIATDQNPADLISRGMDVPSFISSRLWRSGPEWLSQPEEEWPKTIMRISPSEQNIINNECKPIVPVVMFMGKDITTNKAKVSVLYKYNNLFKILRVTAYVFRYKQKLLTRARESKENRAKIYRSTAQIDYELIERPDMHEIQVAYAYWIKAVQKLAYRADITSLSLNDKLPGNSKIASLRPFLDKNGLVRASGRLNKSTLPLDTRNPIIIPPKSRLAWLIMDEAHKETKHGGVQLMTHHIREKFWIPQLRRAAKTHISRCVTCCKHSKALAKQIMGDLPAVRVTQALAFRRIGIDFAGPFNIRLTDQVNVSTRNRASLNIETKAYVAVFVCLVTRAIHLETVSDMTTERFLAAFNRFVGDRAEPEIIFSDNGTTFVGADNELKRIYQVWQSKEVQDVIARKGTKRAKIEHKPPVWKFITPAAPHQGGMWESAVKSMKHHLKRVLGVQKYTFEGLQTILKGITACLNSRPLCALSDDINDLQALTPNHFLTGGSSKLPVLEPMDEPPVSLTKLYQAYNYTIQRFWERWSAEYIPTLMQRPKWREERENLKIGQLVLIANENYPPTHWVLGRISAVREGADNCVRSATIRIDGGKLDRPIHKLCVLPVDDINTSFVEETATGAML